LRPEVAVTAARELPLAVEDRLLVVRLGAPHAVLSWAVVNGGRRTVSEVAWHEVRDDELRPPVDAAALLRARLAAAGIPGAVGLLTSRALAARVVARRSAGGVCARCVATVGLGNALRAGDPPGPAARIGTINVLCQLSAPLSEEALVEALSIATEARTLAVLEAGVPSRRTGLAATGTGTDCLVIAAPEGAVGRIPYAGKHTAVGHVVGAAVHAAVARGAAAWVAEWTS
jgi:adenosylcobinamide amidohydrolase